MKQKFALLTLVTILVPGILLADDQPAHKTGRSPIVLAEISSDGDVRLLLTVYADGEAILARKDADEPDGEICSAIVPTDKLDSLTGSLHEAGALHLSDAEPVPNFTRKTISFFIGPDDPARTRGNTFNYFRAEGPYLIVAQALNSLISSSFGDCD